MLLLANAGVLCATGGTTPAAGLRVLINLGYGNIGVSGVSASLSDIVG